MGGSSRLWLVSAALLASGALLTGIAETLYWQPCAGQMLTGSILNGYRMEPGFTDACLVAMDEASSVFLPAAGGGWTMIATLSTIAAMLLAMAWLVLLPTLRLSSPAALVVALPAVGSLALAVSSVPAVLGSAETDDLVRYWLIRLIEPAGVVTLVVLAISGVTGRLLFRFALVLLASTPQGVLHLTAEYGVAIALSEAYWDTPPGAGYLTVAFIGLAALATFGLWLRERHQATASRTLRETVPAASQGSPASRPSAAASPPTTTTTM